MAKKIKDFKELEGKSLNDLAMEASKEEKKEEEISEELLDNRDYDKYDYYEVDLKKGTKKNYAIMFLLYLIVIALVILIVMAIKYKDQIKYLNLNRISIYEIKN